jgi:hypothetical protein
MPSAAFFAPGDRDPDRITRRGASLEDRALSSPRLLAKYGITPTHNRQDQNTDGSPVLGGTVLGRG